ncbi:MAG TPA: SLBB domain-containing protein [Candidatus Syntrophosphaera sp.]|nr:SLBB domain-containing protein [Candidatus Syntrophosphaera sp.]
MKTRLILLALLVLAGWLTAQTTSSQPVPDLISINVTGFVAQPGTYQVSSAMRLANALHLAKAQPAQNPAPDLLTPRLEEAAVRDSLLERYQALRSVVLIRSGESKSYDLLKYERLGDLSHNPLLRDGDVVVVASVQTSVSLTGGIYLPGEYEYVAGDDLAVLLALARGFTLDADRQNILLYRYRDNLTDFDIINLDLMKQDPASIKLLPHDRVVVSRDNELRRAWKIRVEGQVKAPGDYLVDGTTTLYDILQRCGGPTPNGDLRNAIFASALYSRETDPEFDRLKERSLSEMTILEYHYIRSRLRQFPGRYSIDVLTVWQNQSAGGNPILKDGDYLYVPEQMSLVEVSGQVVRPGLIPWMEGKTWDYYIDAAGGYTNNKRWKGVRIISAASGNWVRPSKKLAINPGDNIFVAERTDRDFWTDFKDVLLITSQVLTIFLGIRALSN